MLLLTCWSNCAVASEGDKSWGFHVCVWRCNQTACTEIQGRPPVCSSACPGIVQDGSLATKASVPLMLRLARWSCEDDCKYLCMHESEEARKEYPRGHQGGSVLPAHHSTWKYFGEGVKIDCGLKDMVDTPTISHCHLRQVALPEATGCPGAGVVTAVSLQPGSAPAFCAEAGGSLLQPGGEEGQGQEDWR